MENREGTFQGRKTNEKNQTRQRIRTLPQDVISEILSRLPVKSLLIFKLVCKSWCSLISSPEFVNTHLRFSSQEAKRGRYRLILSRECPIHNELEFKCSCISFVSNRQIAVDYFGVDFPLNDSRDNMRIVGSCNGLVCLVVKERSILLWNPSTRKCRELVELNSNGLRFGGVAFGYDDSCRDYNVVIMVEILDGQNSWHRAEVWVYSLNTDSLEKMQKLPDEHSKDLGALVNRVLYRLSRPSNTDNRVVISLDLVSESYGELMLPTSAKTSTNLRLEAVGGSLGVIYDYPGRHLDLWTMKGHGMKDCWSKVAKIPYMHSVEDFGDLVPLYITKKSEILLKLKGLHHLLVFLDNSKVRTVGRLHLPGLSDGFDAHTYVESLVSPFGMNEDANLVWTMSL